MRVALRVAGAVVALIVVALGAIAVAVATIDVDALIGPLRERVKAATGRELAIGGIDVRVSPVPRIVLSDLALANAPWGKAPHFATVKRAEAQIALRPLLSRRVEIVELALFEPVVALEADARGGGNWTIAPTAGPAGAPATAGGTSVLGVLGVDRVAITGGSVSWRGADAAASRRLDIETLHAQAGDAQAPIAVALRGRAEGIAVEVEGTLPSLATLGARRGPYPLALDGSVAGRKASVATVLALADGDYRLGDLRLAWGAATLRGEFTVRTAGPRPRFVFDLAAGPLAPGDLPPLPNHGAAPAPVPLPASTRVFADDAVDFALLKAFDADGHLAVERLALPDGRRIERISANVALRDARLDASLLTAAMLGGTVRAQLQIDGRDARQPAIRLRGEAKGLELAALLALAGVKREVRGGSTDVSADIATRGVSPRQWAGNATGQVVANVGAATVPTTRADADSAFGRLAELVNPFRSIDAATVLVCGVVRLPLANGVARIDRSIGIETQKVGVAASGTIDFRNETLDLALKPRVKAGVEVKLLQVASLVRVKGSFAAPAVGIDAMASAQTAARVGAAVATAGLSVLGETLLGGVARGGESECALARGRTSR
jgi:uncharacterized protein involved in outer membrane biogenesis